jgi:hypothetical protein
MKQLSVLIALLITSISAICQEIQKDLKPFTKIVASPRINLILQKGNTSNIRLVYDGVSKDKINMTVKGKTLQIFLDDARSVERTESGHGHRGSHGIYEGVSVTAYVTYQSLEALEIRGSQELTCLDAIDADRFTLKAYGDNKITLASLKTEFFKAALYGENKLTIKGGKVIEQKYRLYGQNKINTLEMKSAYTSTSIFGEGTLSITSSEEVRVNAFGEPRIEVDGGAHVNRRLVFGRTSITRR